MSQRGRGQRKTLYLITGDRSAADIRFMDGAYKYRAKVEHAAGPLSIPVTSLRYNGHFYTSSLVPPTLIPRLLPFFPSNL